MKKENDSEGFANSYAEPKENRDPITHTPGAHPVGVAGGAAGVGTLGTAIGGALGGPIGAAVGAAVGAVAGGLLGKGTAEFFNPTLEDAYWRDTWHTRHYVDSSRDYEYYRPAYKYGWEARRRHKTWRWEEAEPHLEEGWTRGRGASDLGWIEARPAVRDAWLHRDRPVYTANPDEGEQVYRREDEDKTVH